MVRMQPTIIGLLLVGLFWGPSSALQKKKPVGLRGNRGGTNLELTTTGQAVMSTGRRGIFRIYSSPDGTTGYIEYAHFSSLPEAKRQIKDWRKLAQKVKTDKPEKSQLGRVVGHRIAATRKDPSSGREEFLIIKRNGLICYLIKSVSLAVAEQVENMIEAQ